MTNKQDVVILVTKYSYIIEELKIMEFIEKHRRLLVFYYTTLRILGWILLGMGGVGFTLLILEASKTGGGITFEGTAGFVKRSCSAFYKHWIIFVRFCAIRRVSLRKFS